MTLYEYRLLPLLCIVSSRPAIEETKSESDDSLSAPKNPLIKTKLSKETERYDSPFSIRRIKAIRPERFLVRQQSTSNSEKKSRKKAEDKHQNGDNNNDEKNESESKKKFSRKKSEDRRRTERKTSEARRILSRE